MSPLTHSLIDNAVVMANNGAYNPGVTLRLDHNSMTASLCSGGITRTFVDRGIICPATAYKLASKQPGCCADFSIFLLLSVQANNPAAWNLLFCNKPLLLGLVLCKALHLPVNTPWVRTFHHNGGELFPSPRDRPDLADLSAATQATVLKRLITKAGY